LPAEEAEKLDFEITVAMRLAGEMNEVDRALTFA
jgi:hypothetical protein